MGDKLPIPKHLRAKEWNSHKGIIAKLVKSTRKTGITEALTDFQEYYNFKFGWGLTGDSEIAGNLRMAQSPSMKEIGIKQLKMGLKDIGGQFLPTCKRKLEAIKNLATTKAAEFKNSSVIPRSSRVYLEDMAKETDKFYEQLKRSLDDSAEKIKAALSKAGVKT
jgi:hypothetical protein